MPIHATSPYGHPQEASSAASPTLAALKALGDGHAARTHGNVVRVLADGALWRFHASSVLDGDDLLIAEPDDGDGRWLRAPDLVDLAIPIAAAMDDEEVLFTVPVGCVFKLESAHWQITTAFDNGTNASLGVASSLFDTPGDILGGATGDTTAVESTGRRPGTAGGTMDTDAEIHDQLYTAGDEFVKNDILGEAGVAYADGAGLVHLCGFLIRNDGA